MANKTPVWYDGGFGVYTGDDTIHHNYTEAAGNILTLENGGNGNEVLQVLNKGQLDVKTLSGNTIPALNVQGIGGQDYLRIYDREAANHILSVSSYTSGSGWVAQMKTRDPGGASNDDVALRISHDVQTNTPPQGADLLSLGYTNATEVYQELFAMKQSGDFYLQGASGADLLWGTDGAGNIGGSLGNRPDSIYAASTMNANGSVLQTQALQLGPAGATDKTLTALQAATSPYIKYVNGSSKWQFSNDGVTPLDFGTSNVGSWDDLLAASQTMDLDGDAPLTWTQTDVTGYGFILQKTVSTAANALMKIETTAASAFPTGVPLLEVNRQAFGNAGIALSLKGHLDFAALSPTTASKITSAANPLEISTSGSTGNIDIKTTGNNSDISISTAATATPSDITVDSKGLLNLNATGTAAATFSTSSGTMYITSGGALDLTGAAGGTWNLGTASWQLTHSGTTSIGAQIALNGAANINYDAGNCNRLTVTNSHFTVQTLGWNKDLHLRTERDLFFAANASGSIAVNSVADPTLDTSAQNIVGAINEVNTGLSGVTLDDAYNADAGAAAIAVDAGDVTWTLTDPYRFSVLKALTASPAGSSVGVRSSVSSSANLVSGDLVYAYTGKATGNGAGDASDAEVTSFLAQGDNTTGGLSYGFHADAKCGLGVYSESPVRVAAALTDGTAASGWTTANYTTLTSGGTGLVAAEIAYGVTARVIANAGDAGGSKYYGFFARGDSLTGSAAHWGYYADSKWDYSVNAESPLRIIDATTDPTDKPVSGDFRYLAPAAALTGETSIAVGAIVEWAGGDAATAEFIGFSATGDATATSAQTYGHYADENWVYGLYSESSTAVYVQGITATKNVTAVVGASGGLGATGEEATCININWQEHASAEVATINGIKLDLTEQALANNTKYGIKIDGSWTYGVHTSSPAYVNRAALTGADDGFSVIGTSNGLGASGNEVNLIRLAFTEAATDNDSVNGVKLSLTPDASATNTTRAVEVDINWDRGLYSTSPIESYYTHTSAVSGFSAAAAAYLTSRSIQTGQSSASPMGLHVDLEGNSSDTGGSLFGVHVDADDGGGAATCYGFYTPTSSDLDFAFYANSKSYFTEVLNANGGPTYAVKVLGNTFSQTGFTSSGLYVEHLDGGTGGGFFEGITLEGDSSSTSATTGINIDNEWDIGFVSGARGTISDTFSTAEEVLHVTLTTSSLPAANTAVGVKATVNSSATDNANAVLYGLHASANTNTGNFPIRIGLNVDGFDDYSTSLGRGDVAIYTWGGNVFHQQTQTDGFGGNTYQLHGTYVKSDGTGLDASDEFIAYHARLDDDPDDSGDADYFGFYAQNSSPAGSSPKHAYYVENTFENTDYAFHSESSRTNFYSNFGALPAATGYVHNTLTSVSGGSNATASEWNLYVNCVTHASDGDGFDFRGIQLTVSDIGGGSNTTAMYVDNGWDRGIYLDNLGSQGIIGYDSWLDLNYDHSAGVPSSGTGLIDVALTMDTALTTTTNGIVADVDPHVSDTGTFRAFHAEMTGTAPDAGDYIGFHVDDDYDTGFYAGSNVRTSGFWASGIGSNSVRVTAGQMANTTHTGDYTHTGNTTALVRSQSESDGISSDGWRSFDGTFVRHASDTSAGKWYGFIAGVSGSVGSAVTTGYRAQSTLDIGISSYADRNTFQRNDDTYAGSEAVVLVENNDNDSAGGYTAAIKAGNTASSTASKVIEIDSAYSSSTEGTRRMIVSTNTVKNRRVLPMSAFQPGMNGGTNPDWYYLDGTTGTSGIYGGEWRTNGNPVYDRLYMPLHLPHLCTMTGAVCSWYPGGGGGTGGYLYLQRKTYQGIYNQWTVMQTSTSTSTAGSIGSTSWSTLIDNDTYQYQLCLIAAGAGTSVGRLYGIYIEYTLTDLMAGQGY